MTAQYLEAAQAWTVSTSSTYVIYVVVDLHNFMVANPLMARGLIIFVVAALDVVGLLRSVTVEGCSQPVGWRPLSNVEKVHHATDVLFGSVRQTYPDRRFDYGGSSGTRAYTAEFDVFCVLKGRRTPPVLNITEAGALYVLYTCLRSSCLFL